MSDDRDRYIDKRKEEIIISYSFVVVVGVLLLVLFSICMVAV